MKVRCGGGGGNCISKGQPQDLGTQGGGIVTSLTNRVTFISFFEILYLNSYKMRMN